MSDRSVKNTLRRRFITFGLLTFAAGLVAGAVLGVFGARFLFFHLRPDPNAISIKRADRLKKDFSLTDDIRDKIVAENHRLFEEMEEDRLARHEHMEKMIAGHVENIARLLPNEEARNMWRKNVKQYFPPPPPLPPPPPRSLSGPPPSGK